VLSIVRRPTEMRDAKLLEIVHEDFTNFEAVAREHQHYDACLFCLGVSSLGMSEAEYRRVTYDFTLAAANAFVTKTMTFIYISGVGTDSTEKKRTMWARVKGTTENALLKLPFKAAFMFRPGYIQPMHGIVARNRWTRVMYKVMGPLYPLWRRLFPRFVTTSEQIARAMVLAAKRGYVKPIVDNADIAQILKAA
jgi:uncharacterized protein YbjT (DUF2867 family)